ncbi:hypothetical protein [Streptomyces scopuliridis]|uniref:hypothetical protein n=1 Tax=Streptomyces scopuliridis TaxID=452529 RepID=UPI00367BD46F
MAVNLVKPDPDDDGLADVVELVAVDDLPDDGEGAAAQPSRLRVRWGQVLRDAERNADTPRSRFMTRPELGAYSFFNRGVLVAVKTGTGVIFRGAWTLIRRGWVIVADYARKARGKGAKASPPAEEGTGGETQAKDGKPAIAKKEEGKKKPPPKQARSGTVDVVLGGLLVAGMGAMFVIRTVVPTIAGMVADTAAWVSAHPLTVFRGIGLAVIIFVPIAWIVGGVVGAHEDHHDGDHDGGAADVAVEAESPEDHEEGQGSGEAEAESDGGEVVERSPEDDAEQVRIRVYEWVRESITTLGNGTAVHLRELLISVRKQKGGEGVTMADLRAHLGAQDIPVRDGVKAPASDRDGATCNRPGVHRVDLPQGVTPLPAPGSNLIRLLPTYQASDQA